MTERSSLIKIIILQDFILDPREISIPKKVIEKIDFNKEIFFKFGAEKKEVNCTANDTEDIIYISSSLVDEFSVYSGMKTNFIINENVICIGPVIGSFTDTTSVRIASEQRPGTKLKCLCESNRDARTILYFFSVNDFDSENERIHGTYYNYVAERWEKGYFPIPDVLHDRGGGILNKQKGASQYIRETIEKDENVMRFNPRYYFDKWQVYDKLNRYEEVKKYLPLTIRYRNANDLLMMLEKSKTLYIKDRVGNRGIGVTRIVKLLDGTFDLSYFTKELFQERYYSFEGLVSRIDELYKGKNAIIQPSIDMIKVDEGNVDMRATVQRDGNGNLSIIACPVRLGKSGAPITSTRSGSKVYRFEEFFMNILNYPKEKIDGIKTKIDDFLISTYKAIEDIYGRFGEIGIDFAIDKSGEIWFIECNAKPGKDTVYLSYDKETIKKAFLNPLEYAKYIAGY